MLLLNVEDIRNINMSKSFFHDNQRTSDDSLIFSNVYPVSWCIMSDVLILDALCIQPFFSFLLTQLYLPAVPWWLGYFCWVCQAKRGHTAVTTSSTLWIAIMTEVAMHSRIHTLYSFFSAECNSGCCLPSKYLQRECCLLCSTWTAFVVVNIVLGYCNFMCAA